MGLAPLNAEAQLHKRRVCSEQHIKAKAAVPELTAKGDAAHQWAAVLQLHLPSLWHGQRMRPVISRKIPGIPEFTVIAVAAQAQWGRQMGASPPIPQSDQTLRPNINRKLCIEQPPTSAFKGCHSNGVANSRGDLARISPMVRALERHCTHAINHGQLHPNTTRCSNLRRQLPTDTAPVPSRQAHKRRPER